VTGSEPHPVTGQPTGLPVDATPAKRGEVVREGRCGRREKLKATRKLAFERWLAPEIFDAEGRQIESLSRLDGARA
jgi:hypothetical protein